MGGMFPGRGGPGPMEAFMLLRVEKVQKELNITEDQYSKLDEAGRDFMEQMRESFGSLRDLSDEERRTKMDEMAKESQEKLDKTLAEILQPKQLERFEQIQLQVQGPMAVTTPKVGKAVNIADDQKEKIQTIRDEMRNAVRDLMGNMRDLSPEQRREKMNEMRDKFQQLNKETGDKILAVLNQEQRDKFQKMQGEKFDLDLSTLFPRGPRGGGGPPPGGGMGPPPGEGGPPPQ